LNFEAKAYAAGKKPDVIRPAALGDGRGMERLKNAMRAYRGWPR